MRLTIAPLVAFRTLGLIVLSFAAACGSDEDANNNSTGSDSTDQTSGSDSGASSDETDETDESSSDDTTADPGDSTADTTTQPPVTEPHVNTVGVACEEDDDCADGLICLTSDEEMGGALPGGGVCSVSCADSEQCWEHDQFSLCVNLGVAEPYAQYCMQACLFGAADGTKCSGLAEQTCYPLGTEVEADDTVVGACFPQCQNDGDCSSGAHCDTWSGLCIDEELPGKAAGEVCDLEADECASGGVCMGIAEGIPTGFCSTPCNLHAETLICGNDTAGPDAKAICFPHLALYDYLGVYSGINDIGQCLPLCDEDSECPPGMACDLSEPALPDLSGRAGLCLPTEESVQTALDAIGGASAMPDAAASEADAAPGETTAETGETSEPTLDASTADAG